MSKVSRSDWSASTPWSGIVGKPTSFGITDISQITAVGFSSDQVPRWNGSRFTPYTIPSSSTPVTPPSSLPSQVQFSWDVPAILPLQSAYEDFPLIGAVPGEPIAHGVAFDPGFCLTFAYIFANDTVRLKVVNMNSAPVDLGAAVWSIQRFNNS